MKCLVTGASGFIGRHLVEALAAQGHSVAAVSRSHQKDVPHGVTPLNGSILGQETAAGWMRDEKPDAVIHLAAQSLPRVSWEDPAGTFDVNINGTINLLCALQEYNPSARFIFVSSSSVYAPRKDGNPIDESGELGGASPYAWSKLAAEQGALLYGNHHGLNVVIVRPFFIIGAGKTGDVSSDFARRIVDVERGTASEVTIGNLEAVRDFLDVEDAVRGMMVLLEQGEVGKAYNLCSGVGTSIRDVLNLLKSCASCNVIEREDPALMRPLDEPVKVGNPQAMRDLGWQPQVTIEESMKQIITYWREQP